jgi:hypothetical protein
MHPRRSTASTKEEKCSKYFSYSAFDSFSCICPIRIPPSTSNNLIRNFRVFPQSEQENVEIIS